MTIQILKDDNNKPHYVENNRVHGSKSEALASALVYELEFLNNKRCSKISNKSIVAIKDLIEVRVSA